MAIKPKIALDADGVLLNYHSASGNFGKRHLAFFLNLLILKPTSHLTDGKSNDLKNQSANTFAHVRMKTSAVNPTSY